MITENYFSELAEVARVHKANNKSGTKELIIQIAWLTIGTLLSFKNPTWLLGQIILGIGFWRTFAILHACGHGAFFNNRKLNNLIGFLLAPLCFIPYYPWKYIHQDHHAWTGWKDIDPTTLGLMKRPKNWQQKVLNFCWKTWIPLISIHYILTVFFDINHSSFRVFNRKLMMVILSIIWVISFHLILIAEFGGPWITVFALSTFIYLNLGDISLLTQHVHLPLDVANGASVNPKFLWEQDQYSHTMIFPEFATKWIVLGFNHHSLHHLFPRLPYYKSHLVPFEGTHTHDWKEWILKAKGMKATDLIFDQKINSIGKHGIATPLISTVSSPAD